MISATSTAKLEIKLFFGCCFTLVDIVAKKTGWIGKENAKKKEIRREALVVKALID